MQTFIPYEQFDQCARVFDRQRLGKHGVAICDEWIGRGYRDTCKEKILSVAAAEPGDLPFWWGDSQVHLSHRRNLLKKNLDFYD